MYHADEAAGDINYISTNPLPSVIICSSLIVCANPQNEEGLRITVRLPRFRGRTVLKAMVNMFSKVLALSESWRRFRS